MKKFLSLTALSLIAMTAAFAQTAAPAVNPLKPATPPVMTAPAVKPAVMPPAVMPVEKKADEATKPKRERSAKQKANDDLMRKCGAERRADIAAGKKDVLPWLKYLPECRKRQPVA